MTEHYPDPYALALSLAKPIIEGNLLRVEALAALINDALRCERAGMGDAGEILRASRRVLDDALTGEALPPQPEHYHIPPPSARPTEPVVIETAIHGPLTASQLRAMDEERRWLDREITGHYRPETLEGDVP